MQCEVVKLWKLWSCEVVKKTVYDEFVRKVLMLFRLMILVIYFKKKIKEIENKIPDVNKNITIDEFNEFLGAIFDERLKKRI